MPRCPQGLNVWGAWVAEIDAKEFITVYTFFGDHHRQSDRSNHLILWQYLVGAPGLEPGPAD